MTTSHPVPEPPTAAPVSNIVTTTCQLKSQFPPVFRPDGRFSPGRGRGWGRAGGIQLGF